MVTMTEKAIQKVQTFFRDDPSLQGKALRMLVEQGGCAGLSYGFTFDVKKPGDEEAVFEGFSLVIDPESRKYLEGSTVDYKESAEGEGFVISNPNAKSSCGCGHSFNA